ncbi:MAG: protein kinase [Ilumatobacteraceae bacterium]
MSNADQTIRLGGRYRLDRRIATGGMGEVWSATDEVLGRVVAAKMLQANLMDEPGFLDRFRAEARHAASLSHPGIATVYDYGESNGHAYLVMELVDGRTLSHLLAVEAPLAPGRVASILAQTCAALAAAHAAGVVHRDIKPGNIMLTSDERVKITDFGISKLVGSVPLTATGQVLGTPQYISPEQTIGSSATSASDIYSLGVIGYEMLSGHRPFQADTPIGLAMAHVHQTAAPLPSGVPRQLATAITEMMRKDPAARPTDAAALSRRFEASIDSGSTAVAVDGLPGPVDTVLHTAVQPRVLLTDPPTAIARPAATIVGVEDERPHRSGPAVIALVFALILVIVGVIAASRGTGGNESVTSLLADPASASPVTTASVVIVPASPAATTIHETAAPTTVVATTIIAPFDPMTVVGLDHGEAKRQLESLGYDVREEKVNGGGGKKNSVIDVRIEPLDGSPGRAIIFVSDGKGGSGDD